MTMNFPPNLQAFESRGRKISLFAHKRFFALFFQKFCNTREVNSIRPMRVFNVLAKNEDLKIEEEAIENVKNEDQCQNGIEKSTENGHSNGETLEATEPPTKLPKLD